MKWKDFNPQKKFFVGEKPIKLKKLSTEGFFEDVDKKSSFQLLQEEKQKMFALQEVMMAERKNAVWVVIQAMDAAGKDSTIEHVFSGLNPQGIEITSFKAPSTKEYAHDFLWRHYLAVPTKGKIGIHNRSHYEFLTTCKIHPEFNLSENLPHIKSVDDIDDAFWQSRFESIQNMEKHLAQNGVTIIKLFLHLSKDEQKNRFLDRINEPDKNWKFNAGDLKERALWDGYEKAFEEVFEKTARQHAPWYIIPADKKWYARLAIAKIVNATLESMQMDFPKLSAEEKNQLTVCKNQLLNEK